MNILFATSEAHPLIKTGGLADVSGSLPRAIRNAHQDIRLILPAYPAAVAGARQLKPVAEFSLPGSKAPVRLLQGWLPHTRVRLYLVDAPEYFDRPGNPYTRPQGGDWPDNAQRFALFARAVCAVAMNRTALDWQPDIVHCNDWQTGLVPALLSLETNRPATLFTIHNLAYQGLFSHDRLHSLQLPADWWSLEKLEFHHQLSFIKGGLVFADHISTVSPTYAREIRTKAFGCGLEGLLEHRKTQLSGILNGVDYQVWSPGRDTLLPHTYTATRLAGKRRDKAELQKAFGLPARPELPLLGHVGRLVDQKGIDLILELLPTLLQQHPMQLVILGTGQPELETALRAAATQYPQQLAVRIDYNEALSHLLEAGSDIFLMPSRFEPCGLNQLYSLRYGTPPVVRRTGGLADSVVDASEANLRRHTATGFVFEQADTRALLQAIERALALYRQPERWRELMRTGMQADFSWKRSAAAYIDLYAGLLDSPHQYRATA
ncbi:MAG TPA: glycogen synthase GlgA [Gammaproteobacteria bacterium]|nr:glycogen synthase GlgA [Gammaproteobacteria bacterium]